MRENGSYIMALVDKIIVDPDLATSFERVAELLIEAQTTIDELHEQNILMRKILEIIDDNGIDEFTDNSSCSWCGNGFGSEATHDRSCIILSVRILLPTIPEIK